MRTDPWENVYCCSTQRAFGTIVPSTVPSVVAAWIADAFGPGEAVTVRVAAVRRVRDAVAEADRFVLDEFGTAGSGESSSVMPDEFDSVDIEDFTRVLVGYFHGNLHVDSTTVLVVLSADLVGLIYSHRFGDETVFWPKSERLNLGLSGCDVDLAPELVDRLPLTRRRIVEGGLRLSIGHPRTSLGAVRRIVETSRDRVSLPATAESGRVLDTRGWWSTVRLEGASDRKLPSVYFYCALLAALGRGAHESHHVVADLRSYSRVLTGTGGNAFSHIPFRANWAVDDPAEVAGRLARRIRSGEALIRRSIGELISRPSRPASESSEMVVGAGDAPSAPLTTSMSCFRLAPDRQYAWRNGDPTYSGGMQTLAPNALSINIRATRNVSDCTFSHAGGHVDMESVSNAVKIAAGLVGTDVTMETGFYFGEQ
ncbi:hypothetical protein ABH922_000805 [Rhodococcus sp. 27YEA15]|uniref:hypothetical protein n=1 Tax=Rhodococcus sp. 27YEA15 TaxID=3156259 RepID=UPI003C7DD10A